MAKLKELENKARILRKHIIQMTCAAGSGHPGGSLSAADIVAALYFHELRLDPSRPDWPDRDRFILSKGTLPLCFTLPWRSGAFSRWRIC